jgi:hypothetical protein
MKPVTTGPNSVPRVKQILQMEYPDDSLLLGPNRPGRWSSSSFITSEANQRENLLLELDLRVISMIPQPPAKVHPMPIPAMATV